VKLKNPLNKILVNQNGLKIMRKLKILMLGRYVESENKSWGGDFHSKMLGKTFAKFGHSVYFVNCDLTRDDNGIKYIKLNYKKYRNAPYYPDYQQLSKLLREIDFDVIQSFSTRGYIFKKIKKVNIPKVHSQLVSRKLGAGYKYSFEFLLNGQIFRYLAWKMEKLGCKNSDIVITTSRAMKLTIEKEYGIKGVKVIPRGVDINNFKPQKYPKSDEKIISTYCRIEKSKGLDYLIKSMKYVKKFDDSVKLLIAGSGDYKTNLIKRVDELDLYNNVKFLGRLAHDKIPELVSKSWLVVLASPFEPFGATLIEGMACSRPVIGINSGGPADIIDDGINGYLAAPRNPKSLAEKIIDIFKDPENSIQMGINGRKKVEKYYNWEFESKQYLKIYNSLLEGEI
jgi:glycosyltransferase involved in cell wall biosynthesis